MSESKTTWVKTSERLPERAGRYLCTSMGESGNRLYWLGDYSNHINPLWLGDDVIFPNGYAFGDDWEDGKGIDNLCFVEAWAEVTPYEED